MVAAGMPGDGLGSASRWVDIQLQGRKALAAIMLGTLCKWLMLDCT